MSVEKCRAESTRDTYDYGQYINQFSPNTIKVIQEFERIQKKICRHKMSIMLNEICINEEMLPIYIYIYTLKRYICSETDCMIEIFGKLDKSNTSLKLRCVIFRSALFTLYELNQDRDSFPSFLFKNTWGEWKGYCCSRRDGRDLKSHVSGFIKDIFCFESGDDLRELIRKM